MIPQALAVFRRLSGDERGQLFQHGQAALFTAKGQIRYDPRLVQQSYGTGGKPLRRSDRKHAGELNDQIRARFQRPLCPGEFIRTGRLPPLHEVAGHDHHAVGGAGKALCLLHVIDVPVVQRIVFRHNTHYPHRYTPVPHERFS